MLSLALEKKCFVLKQKVMLHTGWEFLQRKDRWWWIHHGRDGSNIWKEYLYQVPNFGVLSNKDETGRVTCTRRESQCSVSVWVV
jgi:hypothetical protein